MRILVVSCFLPHPLFSGGHVRLYNLLKKLSEKHEITLICEKRKHQTQGDIDALKKICKEVVTIDRKKQWSPEVIIKTAFSSFPFLLEGHNLPAMKKVIKKTLAENRFDVIHVETFYVMQNIPETTIPIVLTEHNIEYSVYQKFAKRAPILLRPFLQIDIEKIKHWEKLFWKKAKKVVAVSQHEAIQIGNNAEVVPNGVNLSEFPFKSAGMSTSEKTKTALFLGDFKWIQNRDAAAWILKDIWPLIERKEKKKDKSIKLWIVGKHIPQSLRSYTSQDVIFDEHAPDKTSDIYKKADILLAPIKVGGGTSYKILEAMASGVPVVTTRLGVEGLQAIDGVHALVGEASDVLAEKIGELLTDEKKYEKIRKSARQLIEKEYSWESISQKLEKVYEKAISK